MRRLGYHSGSFVLLIALIAGCVEGPGRHFAVLNPWLQRKIARDAEFGLTWRDKVEELRSIAARSRSMGEQQARQKVLELSQLVETEKNNVLRMEVVRTLAAFKTSEAEAAVRKALQDADKDIRVVACQALEEIHTPGAVSALAGVVGSDADADVRMAAVRALATFKDPIAVRALGLALDERDNPALQYRAVASLQEISDKDYGDDLVAWRQYVKGENPGIKSTPSFAERINPFY